MRDGALPPRQRIIVAARELFYRHGVQGVGVEAIAEAAGTNKMTLYRHFESKDLLVAEYLRGLAEETARIWDEIAELHPGDALAQIRAWLDRVGGHGERHDASGCALVNAAIQISDPEHPGRKFVESAARTRRERLTALCCASGLTEPEQLADHLFLLVEGARASYRSVGPDGPGAGLCALAAALLASHRATDHAPPG
ncbi:TetR/AcrR family transcriptional regulator [Mesorhizobium sp. BR1-1-16]|uniref:TetR/AcrR family transcriptional regulator n=1 Tax=Mesorhizobium sp. BR1-1-16 TaxID=2876653 RepID=UPI001CCBEA34|nr:TetR/AcrR family transcriptional regulator [Mesorhizobium sp. BR1-1-16]MBZ9935309.1 TetR/AcrR family transcriptional regulator [Mesorhizobium sp. BR1-1-16]